MIHITPIIVKQGNGAINGYLVNGGAAAIDTSGQLIEEGTVVKTFPEQAVPRFNPALHPFPQG